MENICGSFAWLLSLSTHFFNGSLNYFGTFGIFVKFIKALSAFSFTPQCGQRRGGKGEAKDSENVMRLTCIVSTEEVYGRHGPAILSSR